MALKVKNTTVIDDDRHIVNIVDYNGYVPANAATRINTTNGIQGGNTIGANVSLSANLAYFDTLYTTFSNSDTSSAQTIGQSFNLSGRNGAASISYAGAEFPSDAPAPATNRRIGGWLLGASGWNSPAGILLNDGKLQHRSLGNPGNVQSWTDVWDSRNLPDPVRTSVTIMGGNGLTGGGDLTANRTLSVGQGNGITVAATTVSVRAGNGLNANTTGVHIMPGVGLGTNASNVFVIPGSGVSANATGIHVTLDANSMEFTGGNVSVKVGAGLNKGATGIFVGAGAGITANNTHISVDNTVARTSSSISGGVGLTGSGATGSNVVLAVQPGNGITANTSGTHVSPKTGGGIEVDAGGVGVDSTVARSSTTISGGAGLQGTGTLGSNTSLSVRPGLGIVANTTGTHVRLDSMSGLLLNATGLAINPGLGMTLGTGNRISVNPGNGIDITAEERITVKIETLSGLEFATGGSLQVKAGVGLGLFSAGLGVQGSSSIVANNTGTHVKVGNGIIADAVGVSVGQGNGIIVSSGNVAARPGNGITVNTTGINVGAGNGIEVSTNAVAVKAGNGIVVNSSGVHVGTGNGLLRETDAISVRAGNGITVNSTGVHVDTAEFQPRDSILTLGSGTLVTKPTTAGGSIQHYFRDTGAGTWNRGVLWYNATSDSFVMQKYELNTSASQTTFTLTSTGLVANRVISAPGFNATSASEGFWGVGSDSAANPSFTWTGSSNVGMWRTSDGIGFSVGGVNRAQVTANGFVGSGGSITGINAANITVGQMDASILRTALNAVSSSAPMYAIRAWGRVAANGTLGQNGNISSVTRVSTGKYNVKFSTNMPNANYVVVGCIETADDANRSAEVFTVLNASRSSSGFTVMTRYSTSGSQGVSDNAFMFQVLWGNP